MPGVVTRGIEPNTLMPLSDKEVQGVTNSEFNMIQEVIKNIDINTASQTFTGGKEKGEVTATQILALQKQAKMMMGLLTLSATLLEKKLTIKRIMIILDKWFDPVDDVVDEIRKVIKSKYRMTSRPRDVGDEGMGVRITSLSEELPTSKQVMGKEDKLKEEFGKPFRIIVLRPEEIKSSRLNWLVTIVPKDKKSSESAKLMFQAMTSSATAMGLQPNKAYVEKRFAEVWEEDPNKMFAKAEGGQLNEDNAGGNVKPPTPNVNINTTT